MKSTLLIVFVIAAFAAQVGNAETTRCSKDYWGNGACQSSQGKTLRGTKDYWGNESSEFLDLLKNAEDGDQDSQLKIAHMYSNRSNPEYDLVIAYAWWTIAADDGSKEAVRMKNRHKDVLNSEQKLEALDFARAVVLDLSD